MAVGGVSPVASEACCQSPCALSPVGQPCLCSSDDLVCNLFSPCRKFNHICEQTRFKN